MANQTTSEEYTEQLFQAIDTIVANRVQNLPYDQTIICTITDDSQAEFGVYTATTNAGSQFTVYSENKEYINGDRVYVRVPQNDFSAQKIITGAYVKDNSDQDTTSIVDSFYIAKLLNVDNGILNIGENTLIKPFTNIEKESQKYDGYLSSRFMFSIVNDKDFVKQFKKSENGIAADYTRAECDAEFDITIKYKRPDTYNNDELQQKTFTISLRTIQPNIFRQNGYNFKYDISYRELITNSGVEPDVLIEEITVSNFKLVGTQEKIDELLNILPPSIVPVKLELQTIEFGYNIENNIGYYVHLFSENDNFYKIEHSAYEKTIYFYCYHARNNLLTAIKPDELSITDTNRLKIKAQARDTVISFYPTLDGQTAYIDYEFEKGRYKLTLTEGNGALKKDLINSICDIALITGDVSNGIILADDTLTLNNKGYSDFWSRFQNGTKFLVSVTDGLPFNGFDASGVHYLYGQDGKPTDSSASYVERICCVQFMDPEGGRLTQDDADKGRLEVVVRDNGDQITNSMLRYPSTDKSWKITVDESSGIAYVKYKVSNYYSQHKNKNTFYWAYSPNSNEGYNLEVPIYFGYNGSQGSEYNLVLDLVRLDGNTDILEQAIRIKNNRPVDDNYYIRATLYNYDNKEQVISSDYYNGSIEDKSSSTSPLVIGLNDKQAKNNSVYFKVKCKAGNIILDEATAKSHSSIAKITIENLALEAFLPIAFAKDNSEIYQLSGPSTITYDVTGKKPNSQKIPYSLKTSAGGPMAYTYNIEIHGKEEEQFPSFVETAKQVVENYLCIPSAYTEEMNQFPPTVYVTSGTEVIWIQPIYICQNKYPSAMTNGELAKTAVKDMGDAGQKGSIESVNVGRLTSSGGLFIGDYKHSDASKADYGLYAFGKATSASNNRELVNTFKLLADGSFEADLTLLKKNSSNKMIKVSSVASSITYPVGYVGGKPATIMNVPAYKVFTGAPHNKDTQATILDVAKGVIAIKELLQQIYSTTPPTNEEILEALDEIKLEVEE